MRPKRPAAPRAARSAGAARAYSFVEYETITSSEMRFEVAAVGRKKLVALMVTSAILVLAALSRLPEQVLQHQASRSRCAASSRRWMAALPW